MGDRDFIKLSGAIHKLSLLTIFSIKRTTVKIKKGLLRNPFLIFIGWVQSTVFIANSQVRCTISEQEK